MYCHRLFRIPAAMLVLCALASPARSQTNGTADVASNAVAEAEAPTSTFTGDFRLRYEQTANQQPGSVIRESRSREVVRFRAGLTTKINELLHFGARLATGSQEDPNTADVTLGNFVDDLDVSLDRVYLGFTYKDLNLMGGKFANPFRRTELVWDGDVNPQGVAASYIAPRTGPLTATFTGMLSIIDEHAQRRIDDSYMWGGQTELAFKPTADVSFSVAGAYYDYIINSLSNADAGDTRSNHLMPDSTGYLSDFDLFDVIAIVEYRGFGERYPIRFVGDFVTNLGAGTDEDQGFMVDLFVGRATQKNDVRFRYGYSQTETDAILAAFSNDNTTIATNYRQHTFTIDYVVLNNTTLNVTWYLYRRNELGTAPGTDSDEYVSRLRLNAVVGF